VSSAALHRVAPASLAATATDYNCAFEERETKSYCVHIGRCGMDAESVIASAIRAGVPMFNAGDAAGCAAVYSNAIVDLMGLVPASCPALVDALERSSASASDQDRAWLLRHALDNVLATLRASRQSDATASAAGALELKTLRWLVVDDRVMGGASQSRMTIEPDGSAVFEGHLVVAGGGFASVRANLPMRGYGFSGAKGLALRCSGDGRQGYKVILKTDTAIDGIMYQASFEAPSSPALFTLPLTAFRATYRGRPVATAPALRGEDVCVIGFMLSRFDAAGGQTDERAGPFRLNVASAVGC
jgi:NADH dehydrogenase [ubiquinone] 1 alpha subcomplex assembly factor 1